MVCGSREKCSDGEGRAERGLRFLRALGLVELGQLDSGFSTQGL